MRGLELVLVAWVGCSLAGCGSPEAPATEAPEGSPDRAVEEAATEAVTARAEDFVASEVRAPSEYLRETRFAAADFDRGELLSYACRACHALEPGQESPLGPHLVGVFGRRAGSLEGFEYSEALRESGIVWTPEALEAWLAQPESFIPGNNMAFTGYRSARDRRDLVAHLLRSPGGTQPEPRAEGD